MNPLSFAKKFIGSMGRERIKEKLQHDPTPNYHNKQTFYRSELIVNELPLFSILTGELMERTDPIVRFSHAVRNAVLNTAEVEIKARNPRVKVWVQKQWDALWGKCRRELLSAKRFGYHALQIQYGGGNELSIEGVKEFHPRDVRALEYKGVRVGFKVRSCGGKDYGDYAKLFGPRGLWLTFNAEYGNPYGSGLLKRQYPPWYEKWMDRGARKLKQQRMIKDAYIGDRIWFPFNQVVEGPNGEVIPWKDIAREIGENRMSGSLLTLPMLLDSSTKQKLVEYEPPTDVGGTTQIFEWEKNLDEGILIGADVPVEVVKAAEGGTGFSGRSIPFMVLAGNCTSEITEIVQCIERDILRPLAWLNWGGDPEFEIKPKSLIESLASDAGGSSLGGGSLGGTPSQGMRPPMQPQPGQQPQQVPANDSRQRQAMQFDVSRDDRDDVSRAIARKALSLTIPRIKTAQERIAELIGDLSIPLPTLPGVIEQEIRSLERTIGQDLAAAMTAGQLAGAANAITSLPDVYVPPATTAGAGSDVPPTAPPSFGSLLPDDDGESEYSFPVVDEAVETLSNARVFTSTDYRQVAEQARQGAFGISGDLTEGAVERVRNILAENIASGADREAFTEQVLAAVEGQLSEAHVEQIFRTNVMSSFSDGADKALEQPMVADAFPYRQYWATTDQRTRPEHRALERMGIQGTNIYRADDPVFRRFRPPWDFNCVLPTEIVQGQVEIAARSTYSGEAVELRTLNGNVLRVTINHPVLTSEGFVAAGLLRKGDKVVSYFAGNEVLGHAATAQKLTVDSFGTDQARLPSPDENEHYQPATIEQVFETLAAMFGTTRMPVRSNNLHGDAAGGNGYVDVVAVNRELLLNLQASLSHGGGDFILATMNESQSLVSSASSANKGIAGDDSPPRLGPSSRALPLNGRTIGFNGLPLQSLRIGSAANINISRFESRGNGCAAHPEFASQGFERCASTVSGDDRCPIDGSSTSAATLVGRHNAAVLESGDNSLLPDMQLASDLLSAQAGGMQLDEIVSIDRFSFSGHVYDLQTSTGWMVAQGIVISNCRCSWNPVTVEQAANQGITEAKEWLARAKAMADAKGGPWPAYLNATAPQTPTWVQPPPFEPPPEFARM
jgi:hypothetical protein